MKFLRHKQRHIVVTTLDDDTTELPEKVKVLGRVGIDSSVEGASRRGRPPSYDKPIPAEDLELLETEDVEQSMLDAALKLLDEVEDSVSDSDDDSAPMAIPGAPSFDEEDESTLSMTEDDDELETVPMDAE